MKLYEVDVYFGGGGDTDSIGTYLVYAMNEEAAQKEAIGESASLINATAKPRTSTDPIDEMDYDGVLGPEPHRGARTVEENWARAVEESSKPSRRMP